MANYTLSSITIPSFADVAGSSSDVNTFGYEISNVTTTVSNSFNVPKIHAPNIRKGHSITGGSTASGITVTNTNISGDNVVITTSANMPSQTANLAFSPVIQLTLTPNEGYVVSASDFNSNNTIASSNAIITSATFTDNGTAATPSNTLKLTIVLNSTTVISSDTTINLTTFITDKAVLYSSLSQSLPVSLTISNNLSTGVVNASSSTGAIITSASSQSGITATLPSSSSDLTFVGNVSFNEEDEQVEVGSFTVEADNSNLANTITGVSTNGGTTFTLNDSDAALVAQGDIVTGSNVTTNPAITVSTIVDAGDNANTVTVSGNMPTNNSIALTFTPPADNQVFSVSPTFIQNENIFEGSSGPSKAFNVLPVSTTTNADGHVQTITYNVFANTKVSTTTADQYTIRATGKSATPSSTTEIKHVEFGSSEIDITGETRTLKVYGDIGAKVDITMTDSAGSAVNVFNDITNGEITSNSSFTKGQSFYAKQFTIPALASGSFTPPFKLNIGAGTGTTKSSNISSASPTNYTLQQRAYPTIKISFTRQASQVYSDINDVVFTGRHGATKEQLGSLGDQRKEIVLTLLAPNKTFTIHKASFTLDDDPPVFTKSGTGNITINNATATLATTNTSNDTAIIRFTVTVQQYANTGETLYALNLISIASHPSN